MGLPWTTPRLFMDDNTTTLYFTDPSERQMSYVRYVSDLNYMGFYLPNIAFNYNGSDTGMAFYMPRMQHQPRIPYYPVGMAIDRGLGPIQKRDYHDCFGNGVCPGASGNWTCECNDGFFGNCAARSCPTGLAWFHEPLVDEIAHDVEVECSNMGLCDRATGFCICRDGYEVSTVRCPLLLSVQNRCFLFVQFCCEGYGL
jgi:hypothetical protein